MIQHISVKVRTPRERVLGGSAVLLVGLGFVTLVNLAYNLAIARFLGPIAFGHTTAVYTLLILISAVTLSFQILTAKIVAQQGAPEAQARSLTPRSRRTAPRETDVRDRPLPCRSSTARVSVSWT